MRPIGHRHGRTHRLARTAGLVVASSLIGVLALAGSATARTAVDPATLNPAPPDFFNAQCNQGAGGTVCTLAFADDPIVDEPSGILCGTTELRFSQDRSVVGKRYYDADGNLVQRHFRESLGGTISNPVTGRYVLWTQHDTVLHNLAIPGDLDSGTIRFSGLETRAWLPGAGTVLTDAGTLLTHAGTGETIRAGGHHPLDAYFGQGDPHALDALCRALD